MGMESRFKGEIAIDPPLNWAEMKKAMELRHAKRGWEIRLVTDQEVHQTDEGETIVNRCFRIVPWQSGLYKGYHVQEALQEIVDAFPDHTFTGHFDCVSEEGWDRWRIAVQNGEVERIDPQITWDM